MTTRKPTTKAEWSALNVRLGRARAVAEELVVDAVSPHIDPLAIAAEERRFLKCMGEDFGQDFDGQLEYHPDQKKFLLFYNTRYDSLGCKEHHPRTRFSIAHELGHYFLEHHRAHYLRGGRPQPSRSEFSSSVIMEREADAFASGLLLPSTLLRPIVNDEELTVERIVDIASRFQTSCISTAISSVQLSDFPCALVGIRDGVIAWSGQSESMIEAGVYPKARGSLPSKDASKQWASFVCGAGATASGSSFVKEWFRTYEKHHLDDIPASECYLPVSSMETLVVLLTIPEDELYNLDEEY